MHFKEKQPEPPPQPEKAEEKETPITENISDDVRELLEYMDHDRLLKHEVLVYFYKYREKKEQQAGPEEPEA